MHGLVPLSGVGVARAIRLAEIWFPCAQLCRPSSACLSTRWTIAFVQDQTRGKARAGNSEQYEYTVAGGSFSKVFVQALGKPFGPFGIQKCASAHMFPQRRA